MPYATADPGHSGSRSQRILVTADAVVSKQKASVVIRLSVDTDPSWCSMLHLVDLLMMDNATS